MNVYQVKICSKHEENNNVRWLATDIILNSCTACVLSIEIWSYGPITHAIFLSKGMCDGELACP